MKYHMATQINLGCGDQQLPGYIGLDRRMGAGVHLLCDLNAPLPLKSQSVDHVYAKSVLEHLDDLAAVLSEIQRVLEPGGTVYVYVPHWSNPLYYSDPTHRLFFGLATFDYFLPPAEQRVRQVPVYRTLNFQVLEVRLIFETPFRLLRWPMKGVQWLVNRSRGGQLFYEFHLSSLIPCYAIEYRLQRRLQRR